MNNEEFEKRMEFIIEQQAQFAADIQQLREVQAQTESIVARLANGTLAGFNDVNAKINVLVDSQINLTEAQSRTDENLRNLIAVVDRYFNEGRNGN
jgi:predicted transcriptional regulator